MNLDTTAGLAAMLLKGRQKNTGSKVDAGQVQSIQPLRKSIGIDIGSADQFERLVVPLPSDICVPSRCTVPGKTGRRRRG
jgi:hypothetical protein